MPISSTIPSFVFGAQPPTSTEKKSELSLEELKKKTIKDLKGIIEGENVKKIGFDSNESLTYGVRNHPRYFIKSLEQNKLDKLYEHQRDFRDAYIKIVSKYNKLKPHKDKPEIKKKMEMYVKLFHAYVDMMEAVQPICTKYMENCSKDVLPHSKSGDYKYPKSHSIFAGAVQDVDLGANNPTDVDLEEFFKDYKGDFSDVKFGNTYIVSLANKIMTGDGSIEDAALKVESSLRGSFENPAVPTHRLGSDVKTSEVADFQVIIVLGTPNDKADAKLTKSTRMIAENAIRRKYGDKVKSIAILDDPDIKELDKSFKNASESIKPGMKQYVFYFGHGLSPWKERGVAEEDVHKQGGKHFEFQAKKIDIREGLTETQIKRFYNYYFKDTETISIFPNCQSGAAVTAICNDRLDLVA